MSVNYNQLSQTYDLVRSEDRKVINLFLQEIHLDASRSVLDFGCGTGNYANALRHITGSQVYGVEPSDGMREKAAAKNPEIKFVKGNHEAIPFDDNFFNFAYMTDVIHHVPDLDSMFSEIGRVLKPGGALCILTQSHAQIDTRFYVPHFPSTAQVDKKRYPDINDIKTKAAKHNFLHFKTVTTGDEEPVAVSSDFIELVEQKGYSMFHLIPEEEYREGLSQLKKDAAKGLTLKTAGSTMVWFIKI